MILNYQGKRTGLIVPRAVKLDDAGFEDLDQFWNEADDAAKRRITGRMKFIKEDSLEVDSTESSLPDYDTSDSISEDEEEEEAKSVVINETFETIKSKRFSKMSEISEKGKQDVRDSMGTTSFTASDTSSLYLEDSLTATSTITDKFDLSDEEEVDIREVEKEVEDGEDEEEKEVELHSLSQSLSRADLDTTSFSTSTTPSLRTYSTSGRRSRERGRETEDANKKEIETEKEEEEDDPLPLAVRISLNRAEKEVEKRKSVRLSVIEKSRDEEVSGEVLDDLSLPPSPLNTSSNTILNTASALPTKSPKRVSFNIEKKEEKKEVKEKEEKKEEKELSLPSPATVRNKTNSRKVKKVLFPDNKKKNDELDKTEVKEKDDEREKEEVREVLTDFNNDDNNDFDYNEDFDNEENENVASKNGDDDDNKEEKEKEKEVKSVEKKKVKEVVKEVENKEVKKKRSEVEKQKRDPVLRTPKFRERGGERSSEDDEEEEEEKYVKRGKERGKERESSAKKVNRRGREEENEEEEDFVRVNKSIIDESFTTENMNTTFENDEDDEGLYDTDNDFSEEESVEERGRGKGDLVKNKNKKSKWGRDSLLDELRERSDREDHTDHEDEGLRRSSRITRGVRCAFWKNERPVYEKGKFKEIYRADPTPRKPPRTTSFTTSFSSSSSLLSPSDQNRNEVEKEVEKTKKRKNEVKAFPKSKLPKNYKYLSRENCVFRVFDDVLEEENVSRLFSTKQEIPPFQIPIQVVRRVNSNKTALAGQYFESTHLPTNNGVISGFLTGFITLPPLAIKDEEMVGEYVQSVDWSDESAQRILLKEGDSYFVPPGNMYRFENHSRTEDCVIYWTIVKNIVSNNNLENNESEKENLSEAASAKIEK